MKLISKLYIMLLCTTSLVACNDSHEYISNDPDAAPDALPCYDVNERYQSYNVFFRPAQGWVGDPMPFYKDGKFHIFYLQDARDGSSTFHPWYKTTTSDFYTYTDDGEMIPTGTVDEQDGALGTGSVFEHNGTYYAFYTGHNGKLDPREKVLLATSTDLNNWTKVTDFALEASWGYDRNEFRDPIIVKDDVSGKFKMFLSTRADYKGSWRAVIAQYSSADLYNWTLEEPYYDDESVFMVECPDIFTMGDYEYIIYSNINDNDRMVHYTYRKTGTSEWIKPSRSNLDGRAYYAGKSASDGVNRYLFAWTPTRGGNEGYDHLDSGNFAWGGSLVAHQLKQNADGTLYTTIPQPLDEKLSSSQSINITNSKSVQTSGDSYTLNAGEEQAFSVFSRLEGVSKISATIKASTATNFGFEFGACGNRREIFAITFDLTNKALQLNRVEKGSEPETITSVSLPVTENKEYNVTIVTENSMCVVYVNGQIAFSNRIYKMNQNPWGIFSNDGSVTFSNVKLQK